MSGHRSFNQVVLDWIDDHLWPRGSSQPQSIVVISKKNRDGTVFEFQSGFGNLQIDGIYNKDSDTLIDVQIQVVAPGHSAVTLAEAKSYLISTAEGSFISFDLENGYVKGSVSFKYGSQGGRRDIFATYSVHLPYDAGLEGTIDVAPTEVTEATGFTVTQLKDIVQFTPSELKDVEEKAHAPSKPGQPIVRAPDAVVENENGLTEEQALFIKFLKDFVVEQDSAIIETYYPWSDDESTSAANANANRLFVINTANKPSNQYHATISFLDILELVASIDPKKLTISATLYAKVPIVGRVSLTKIQGSLDGGGVTVNINVAVAKGKVTFTAPKNKDGKHELYVDATLNIPHYHTIETKGKKRIAVLPF